MNIQVLDAKAGAGKTTSVINAIATNKHNKYLLVQETLDLIEQTENSLSALGVVFSTITSKTSKNTTADLIESVISGSRVIVTTRATFMSLVVSGFTFVGYHCFFDEFPEVFNLVNLKTEWKTAELFQSLYEVTKKGGEYDEITASKECHELKNTKPSDYALEKMGEDGIIAALTSPCHKVFLSADKKQLGILTTPDIFKGMASVTLVGAKYHYHEISMFWKDYPIVESELQKNLRDVKNHANVLIGYFNENRWSKTLKTEEGQLSIIASTLNKFFETQEDYLFTDSEEILHNLQNEGLRLWKVDKYKGSSTRAYLVPCKAAGLNDYRECLNAAFLNSMSRDTAYYVAARGIMGFTAREIYELEVKCHNAYYAYQFCYRTKIREYGFDGEVNFVIGSKAIAEFLAEMIGEGGKVTLSQLTTAMNDVSDHSCFAYTRTQTSENKTLKQTLKVALKEKRSALTKLMDNRNRYNSTAKARGKEIMFCPEEIQLVRAFIKTIDINGEISDMDAKLKLVEEYIGYFTNNKEYKAIPVVEVEVPPMLALVKPTVKKEQKQVVSSVKHDTKSLIQFFSSNRPISQ